ncbi:MAG: AAA family ATPase [Pseudorhodobacter sp.]|nr:AAA family ATPase [Pseudorhodobacter sp.]
MGYLDQCEGKAMRRVMVVGQPGSGKSWLAVRIGARLGVPVYHMDQITWAPGWVERGHDERVARCAAVEAGDAWVFDGNFSATAANRVARADQVVWLDAPVWRRLWAVTWRKVTGLGRVRADMAPGCPEGLGREAWTFYRYIWATRATGRDRIAAVLKPAPAKVVRLTNRAQVARYLVDLRADNAILGK